ncbi:MAG TPA: LacI family DNA-binding transcriptional regulator [Planctomycetota bacterium]|nr:LacI family DNA-binding transcriptional regulator [Planctomycetota bacterium]
MASGSRFTSKSAQQPVRTAPRKLRVGVLGWMSSTDMQFSYCADLLFYLTERAAAEGVDIEMMGAGPTPIGTTLPFPPLEDVLKQKFDGIISNGIWEEPYIGELHKTGVPLVSVDFQPRGSPVDTVIFSGQQGGKLAAQAFIDTGQRSIMVVSRYRVDLALAKGAEPWVEDDTAMDRRMALQGALMGTGIEVWPIVPYGLGVQDKNAEEVEKRVVRLLQSIGGPPSAVFATDGDIALAVGKLLTKLGYRVPEEIGMISFDAPTQIQQSGSFPYSSVSYNWREMGSAGWDLLMKRIKVKRERGDQPELIELPGKFTDRGSLPMRPK